MFYSAENREVKVDETTGAQYWVASLDKLMFTWFDVPAFTTFASHSHESEQITYVLEGELFFEIENKIVCLKKGDCITVPSNIEHKVWTETQGVKAVDAWSPVNNQYQ